MNWPKALVVALSALVLACAGMLAFLGIIASDLRGVADNLETSAGRQSEFSDAQEAAQQRSECLTGEYKEFFAGTAQALSAVLEDRDPPPDALRRLRHASMVLPDIDTICATEGP